MRVGRPFTYAGTDYDIMSLDTDSCVDDDTRDVILRKMFDMKHRGTKKSGLEADGVEGLVKRVGYGVVGSIGGYQFNGEFDIEGISGTTIYNVMIVEPVDVGMN